MEMLVILVGIAIFVLFVVGLSLIDSESAEKREPRNADNGAHGKISRGVTLSMQVIRAEGEDDGRRLNGKPLQTQDDWDRWWVLKGKGDGYLRRMDEIEESFADPNQKAGSELLNEWHSRYDAYASLCKQCGMWNVKIEDHTPYIPTDTQLHRERMLFRRIDKLYQDGISERECYEKYQKAILEYLLTMPGHKVLRKKLFQHFRQDDAEKNKQFRRVFNQLVRNHVLSDRKNKDGNYYVRKAPKRKNVEDTTAVLPHSTFDSSLYASVDNKLLYKVEYTVAAPLNVNRERNTCTFISLSDGMKYSTSLSQCTCPKFDPSYRRPCKHMLALAIQLGYISKSDPRFK